MLVFLVDNIENNFFCGLFFTVWITCLLVRWNLTKLDDLQTLDGYNEREGGRPEWTSHLGEESAQEVTKCSRHGGTRVQLRGDR